LYSAVLLVIVLRL